MRKAIVFLLCFRMFVVECQNIENLVIKLPSQKISVDSIFSLLKVQHNLVVSYSNRYLKKKEIYFSTNELSVKEVIGKIADLNNLNYIVHGNKIILYPQKKILINGTLKDSKTNEIIAGAVVKIVHKNQGMITDESGYYSIPVEAGKKNNIQYSFIGYKSLDIVVTAFFDTAIYIKLEKDTTQIDAVNINKKKHEYLQLDIGRPVQTIDAKEISSQSINNASDLLLASLSGVWAVKSSGMPGDHINVRIRGVNSIFGNVDPLYVIDGVTVPSMNLNSLGVADLNIHDIENISVLKDVSSAALYGFQGGNGVVMIDTKKGDRGNHLQFSSKFGIESFNRRYELMNTKDFLASINLNKTYQISNIYKYYPEYSDTLKNENMQNKIFQTGIIKEYQLSGSFNVHKVHYYISGNYYDHSGIIVNSLYKRYTVLANAETQFTDKISVSIGYRNSIQNNKDNLDSYGGNNIIFQGINKSPLIKSTPLIYYGDYYGLNKRNYTEIGYEVEPTDSIIKNTSKKEDNTSYTLRGSLSIKLTENFIITVFSDFTKREIDYSSDILHYFLGIEHMTPYVMKPNIYQTNIKLRSDEDIALLNNQIRMNWEKKIELHEFMVTAGCKIYKDKAHWRSYSNVSNLDNNVRNVDEMYIRNSLSVFGPGGTVVRDIKSFLGNVVYSYNQKYFVSAAANYEMLKEGKYINYEALFPSVACSWDLAKEYRFNLPGWINQLQLRVDWGRSGNYSLNSLSYIQTDSSYYYYSNSYYKGLGIREYGNPLLKPEMVEGYDFGLDLDCFKNSRLILNVDFFSKTNSNLIILRDIPKYYGNGKIFYNIGEMNSSGQEFSIEVIPIWTKKIQWFSRFNWSVNKQYVKKLVDNKTINIAGNNFFPDFTIRQNEKLGNISGYKIIGPWTADDETNSPDYPHAGNYKFTSTKVSLGNSFPDQTWNWNNIFRYDNFSVGILWYASLGARKYNATRAATYAAGTNRDVNNILQGNNAAMFNPEFYRTSFFVEDASFIKLKQLVFTYESKKKLFNSVGLLLTLSFENLVTFTKYKGYDPEASIYSDNRFSDNSVDKGAFPNPRGMYLSLTLNY
jgi:TonB-dependent starch-binding outer membrane protein SusC